jgi:2-polyprenyl-6-methoxyphenol hydroxylase-like FAD-dependent oxidoreductase
MAPLKILICGGGCAGPSLAFWLARAGHCVTIVERFSALRATGAQIDIRAQGIEVVKRMGLIDVVRSKVVDEVGMSLVDTHNRTKATVLANKTGKGAQTASAEYEIMRGDLVRILYDATKDNVEYIFGVTAERFEQYEDHVEVHFSDGRTDTFDVLVGADGQGSRVRKAILPPDAPEPYRRLGVYFSYWFVPRTEIDDNVFKAYHCPGGRAVVSRSHSPTESQAYFVFRDDSEETRSLFRASVEQQQEYLDQKFHGAGWHTDRFIEGLKTTENFYCQEIVQVRTDTWYKNRVVLLGDAGYCPSPLSAMGTTASFVGAYALAGEINRNSDDLPQAFANYEKTLRPFVNELQNINLTLLLRLGLPKTHLGISILHFIVWLFCFLRIPQLIQRFSSDEVGGWKLPDYPELRQEQ